MVHLFDIARQAHQGAGFDVMSRQFGLDPAQTQRAVEALLPAFTLAFQRNMLEPARFADMLGLVASGRYAPFYDGAVPRPFPGGSSSANALVDSLFGSPEIGRQVAAQASAVSGIGAQVLQQMMPVLAATLIGGMFRYASLEGFAELLGQWSAAIKAAAPSKRAVAPRDPWSAWVEVATTMMGSVAQATAPAPPPPPPDTPLAAWTKAVGSMLGQAPSAPPRAAPDPPDPMGAMTRMFETGREVQAQHLADLQRIMGGAWTSPGKA